ncbi:MAG: hypothetical protein WC005_05185 [Candidatus Nanopelagicales bacterium]
MCQQATCRNCGKRTWTGCGAHVDQVMRGVPKNERCTCTAAQKAAARSQGGFLSRLLGR